MTTPRNIASLLSSLPADILQFAIAAGECAEKNGTAASLVGGIVRDMFLRRPLPPDADVIVEPPSVPVAEALAREFQAELVRHPRFHTFRMNLSTGRKFDIVTARQETYAAPAALPDVTPSTFEKDLCRRDFTINAMLCRLGARTGELMDPFDGHADLEGKVIRALHPKSFEDDPTRIFRAARFAGRLGFQLHAETLSWIRASLSAGHAERLSPVRRRHELELLLREDNPAAAMTLLAEWKALRLFHPAWDGETVGAIAWTDGGRADQRISSRLVALFGRESVSDAESALTKLSFEKTVKRDILSRIGK